MDQLIELLTQIQDLAGVAIDALSSAGGAEGGAPAGPPEEGGAPAGPPEEGGAPAPGGPKQMAPGA